jgi:ribosome biogenesis GTPase / thiamine phosphate phosphatase
MIETFGWTPALFAAFEPLAAHNAASGLLPARITAQHRDRWEIISERGAGHARMSGRFVHDAQEGEHPVVGDWVAVTFPEDGDAAIHNLLPRRTAFTRRASGDAGHVQVIVANVDLALIVMALGADFNPRRAERYLVAARNSGARTGVVLTKADLHDNADASKAEIEALSAGAPVILAATPRGVGLEEVAALMRPQETAVLLGSSGAGKSTLLNALAGRDLNLVGDVRASDQRGRHTTTHRALFALPSGALIIDTPGMRELGLVGEEAALEDTFDDVIELMTQCRFNNCSHNGERGCAVGEAISEGGLTDARWEAYQKLQKELAFEARRKDVGLEAAERKKWKKIHSAHRARDSFRRRNADWEG